MTVYQIQILASMQKEGHILLDTRDSRLCDMPHDTWLIYICVTYSYVIWLIHIRDSFICDMTHDSTSLYGCCMIDCLLSTLDMRDSLTCHMIFMTPRRCRCVYNRLSIERPRHAWLIDMSHDGHDTLLSSRLLSSLWINSVTCLWVIHTWTRHSHATRVTLTRVVWHVSMVLPLE